MMQTTRKKLLDTLGHSLAGLVLLGVATIAINLLLTVRDSRGGNSAPLSAAAAK